MWGACRCTPEEAANVELILRYREAPAAERPSFFAPGYRRHRAGMVHLPEITGAGGSGMVHEDAFPDRADRVVDVIASGDRVWAIWEVTGTHLGDFHGIPGTGNRLAMMEVGAWRLAGGLIAESWFLTDEAAMLRAMGLVAAPGEGPAGGPAT
jgi:SnoaL-like polyketide cyclase